MENLNLSNELKSLANEVQAQNLSRFFKCGPGEYGYGDKFLGINVPTVRSVVKKYAPASILEDCNELLLSPFHELRLAGLFLLIQIYHKRKKHESREKVKEVVDYYLNHLDAGNNWDLVDLVAPKILGDWLITEPSDRDLLYRLSSDNDLWRQRVAIVSTLALIRNKEFNDTFNIATSLLSHKHDLIHKACGWMLREIGKHNGRTELIDFLHKNASVMPRTMLRYAIEHFSPEERKHFMQIKS